MTKTLEADILDKDAPILREIAKEVPASEITSPKIQRIIKRMRDAVASQDDGVAIAAPQIGESLRIFVVAGRALAIIDRNKGEEAEETLYDDMVFVNPVLSKLSRKKRPMDEGCLSVRWLYGEVERSEKATIVAYDEKGKKVHKGASGLLAQIFQHEVDHLNGILFIDKARNIENIPPEHE